GSATRIGAVMLTKNSPTNKDKRAGHSGFTRITVRGYKSLSKEQSIEIRPLTVLAGANSSGKSSIMQPLLLLKQTLEASFDPGALLLDGPNLRFTSADQLLARFGKGKGARTFSVGFETSGPSGVEIDFTKEQNKSLEVTRTKYTTAAGIKVELNSNMKSDEVRMQYISTSIGQIYKNFLWSVVRNRCFLRPVIGAPKEEA